MGSRSVIWYLAVVTFPPLYQPKLVLDLATRDGCKAELTWVMVISKIVYLRNTVTYLRNKREVSWLGWNTRLKVLTTRPASVCVLCLNWAIFSLSAFFSHLLSHEQSVSDEL